MFAIFVCSHLLAENRPDPVKARAANAQANSQSLTGTANQGSPAWSPTNAAHAHMTAATAAAGRVKRPHVTPIVQSPKMANKNQCGPLRNSTSTSTDCRKTNKSANAMNTPALSDNNPRSSEVLRIQACLQGCSRHSSSISTDYLQTIFQNR